MYGDPETCFCGQSVDWPLDMADREDQSRVVGKTRGTPIPSADLPMPSFEERSLALPVLAVLQLRETARVWYVVGGREADGRLELMGYEPRGRYSAPGDGGFILAADFFDRAAGATGDVLEVFLPKNGIPLERAEVMDVGREWCELGPGSLRDVFT